MSNFTGGYIFAWQDGWEEKMGKMTTESLQGMN